MPTWSRMSATRRRGKVGHPSSSRVKVSTSLRPNLFRRRGEHESAERPANVGERQGRERANQMPSCGSIDGKKIPARTTSAAAVP